MLSGHFGNLNTLGTLKLCGNNITEPPKAALGALRALQHLHLWQNQPTHLKKEALRQLNIGQNKISQFPTDAFRNLEHLEELEIPFEKVYFVFGQPKMRQTRALKKTKNETKVLLLVAELFSSYSSLSSFSPSLLSSLSTVLAS